MCSAAAGPERRHGEDALLQPREPRQLASKSFLAFYRSPFVAFRLGLGATGQPPQLAGLLTPHARVRPLDSKQTSAESCARPMVSLQSEDGRCSWLQTASSAQARHGRRRQYLHSGSSLRPISRAQVRDLCSAPPDPIDRASAQFMGVPARRTAARATGATGRTTRPTGTPTVLQ